MPSRNMNDTTETSVENLGMKNAFSMIKSRQGTDDLKGKKR
jgi:hypothetical protein